MPRGRGGHTHLAAPLRPTGRASGARLTDPPKSWNKNQTAFLRQVAGLAKINHHGTIASTHLKNGTLPKGLIEPTGAFMHSFRPQGSSPHLKEGLHTSAILAAHQNLQTMQDHYKFQHHATLLSTAKLFNEVLLGPTGSQSSLRETITFVEKSLTKDYSNKVAQTILQAVSDVASSQTPSTSITFPVLMPLSSSKVPPSMVLQGIGLRANNPLPPGTVAMRRGQAAQSSSGRGTVGSAELHCDPAHTQGAAYHTDEGSSPPAVGTRPSASTALITGDLDASSVSAHPATGSSVADSESMPPYNPLPAGPANTIFLMYNSQSMFTHSKFKYGASYNKLVGENTSLRNYLDSNNHPALLTPLVNEHVSLTDTSKFYQKIASHIFWSEPFGNTFNPKTNGFICNKVRLVRGADDPLSNFYETPIIFDGVYFRTAEHAYQINKLLCSNVYLPYITKWCQHDGDYINRLNCNLPNKIDPRSPGDFKRLAPEILIRCRRNTNKFRNTQLLLARDILIEKAFSSKQFFDHILDPEVDTFYHEVIDQFWGTGFNYYGKLLNHIREILVSVASHALKGGKLGYFGPFTHLLPNRVFKNLMRHPELGAEYDLTPAKTEDVHKIKPLPTASEIRTRIVNGNKAANPLPPPSRITNTTNASQLWSDFYNKNYAHQTDPSQNAQPPLPPPSHITKTTNTSQLWSNFYNEHYAHKTNPPPQQNTPQPHQQGPPPPPTINSFIDQIIHNHTNTTKQNQWQEPRKSIRRNLSDTMPPSPTNTNINPYSILDCEPLNNADEMEVEQTEPPQETTTRATKPAPQRPSRHNKQATTDTTCNQPTNNPDHIPDPSLSPAGP
ncbi:MAG: hypothetical protein MJE68_12830, partial [Proteobacteria bacterium]|nr:hypothetical protein [Pseudomonadota bacterium]